MIRRVASLVIWAGIGLLVLLWLPLVAIVRLIDRDAVRYRTGRWFRRLGLAISCINPNWNVSISGQEGVNDRHPYVMVSNHLSNADIPVISILPWEMKWVAKRELFSIPLLGWMMSLSGDIPVDRHGISSNVSTVRKAAWYLDSGVSVIFFPEGTRSRSGKLSRFSRGAFELAVKKQVPLLPLVLDGTSGCLPKGTWVFEPDVYANLKVLEPVSTKGCNEEDILRLMEEVRAKMAEQLMQWRGASREEVDAMAG
ncbi:MAG: lysophospholipid acyltransferase family protein [Balneolaceae bacterium]